VIQMTCRKQSEESNIGWFTSSFSAGGQCVEVCFDKHGTHVRDSKFRRNPSNIELLEPVISVTGEAWMAFLERVLDPLAPCSDLAILQTAEGGWQLQSADGTQLHYTAGEWEAFVSGVRVGEFSHPELALAGA